MNVSSTKNFLGPVVTGCISICLEAGLQVDKVLPMRIEGHLEKPYRLWHDAGASTLTSSS